MLDLLLERLSLTDSVLLLNSVGCSQCRPAYVEALQSSLESVASKMCADCRRRTSTNPLRVLDCKVPADQPIIEGLPRILDYLCSECSGHFRAVTSGLYRRKIRYTITPRLVRGLDYYTRTTFEITHSGLGSQNALLGGGRYDGLSELIGGPPVKGLGFAIGEDRFLMAVERSGALASSAGPEVFVAWMGEEAREAALGAARQLRREGIRTEIVFDPVNFKKSLALANKMGARWTLIVGDDEVKRGLFQIKDMQTGQQEELPAGRLMEEMRARRNKSAPV